MSMNNYMAKGASIRLRGEGVAQLRAANAAMLKDLTEILKKLDKLPKELRGEVRKKILEQAARPLIEAAKAKAPQSQAEHFDYPKSGGEPVRYYPGNLKKSIRIIPYKKSNTVFVGPKIVKKAKGKAYGRNEKNVNAFYASFVEFGTARMAARPYMRPAFDSSKGQVLKLAKEGLERVVEKYERENKVM